MLNKLQTGLLPAYVVVLVGLIATANFGGHWLLGLVHRIPWGDKLGHFLLFGFLALLAQLAFRRSHSSATRCLVIMLVVATLVFIEELSQLFFVHRQFDFWDLGADMLGIVLFTYLSTLLVPVSQNQQTPV